MRNSEGLQQPLVMELGFLFMSVVCNSVCESRFSFHKTGEVASLFREVEGADFLGGELVDWELQFVNKQRALHLSGLSYLDGAFVR